jgi:hypothetical protein
MYAFEDVSFWLWDLAAIKIGGEEVSYMACVVLERGGMTHLFSSDLPSKGSDPL